MDNNVNNTNNIQSQEQAPVVPTPAPAQPAATAQPQAQAVQNIEQPQVQMTNVQQPPVVDEKKALKKQILFRWLGLAGIVIVVIIFFTFFYENKGPAKMTDAKSVTRAYFYSAIDSKYTDLYDYIYKPDNSFINSNDFNEYLANDKFYSDVQNSKIVSITEMYDTETNKKFDVVLKKDGKSTTYSVELVKDGANEWHVVVDDFYLKDWKIEIPSGAKLYINDAEVGTNLIRERKNNRDVYVLPAIATSSRTFKVVTLFGEIEKEIYVAGSNSGEILVPSVTDEKVVTEALESLKKIWNNMYTDYSDGKDVNSIKSKYFDDNVSLDNVKKYYNTGFDKISNKGNKNYLNKDIVMDSIIIDPKKDNLIESNDIIEIHFGYKITYLVDYIYNAATDSKEYMTRYSSIKLRKTDASYKIYEVTDEKLFNYLKYITKEYK